MTDLRSRLTRLTPQDSAELLELHRAAVTRQRSADWPHAEVSALDEITASLPDDDGGAVPDRLGDRVLGAWSGRIAGNMMGKPVELGPTRASIRAYLESKDAYPLRGYVPCDGPADREHLGMSGVDGATLGSVSGSVRDDDIDYTVLGLHLLEAYGTGYTTSHVAAEWLWRFPVRQVFTAESATYRNLVAGVTVTDAGKHHNPYREWIGALIRADIFGFVCAGHPRRAALLAHADASLSHRANGIYGEMWAAALIASAFTAATPEESVEESLRHIPPTSRLAHEVRLVLDQFRDGLDWEKCLDDLDRRHADMSWVHTINNAGALTAAVLWGGGRFTETVGLAVQAGLDTDSIGATAGAWAGAFQGASALPGHLVRPLEDRCRTGLFGFGDVSIASLAERTVALVDRLAP
ncbi:ADP-ribosylglycohydrolase family protein [Streptomyces sp. NPDC091215]|uniref:ADP-ribosylglycohydrolase family protein n=1 Tax=Streptomyces sp. NPDC091215 TaxID=3155192 RepID=UPI0034332E28